MNTKYQNYEEKEVKLIEYRSWVIRAIKPMTPSYFLINFNTGEPI
jgi:hypothetical protein